MDKTEIARRKAVVKGWNLSAKKHCEHFEKLINDVIGLSVGDFEKVTVKPTYLALDENYECKEMKEKE